MADFGNTQNAGGFANVNTNSIALFAADSTMLRISFSNDMMFFNIIPKVVDPTTGKNKWPKELQHTAAFRPANAAALYKGFMERIMPDIEAKQDHQGYCVIPMNFAATTLCGFSWAGNRACFTIFSDVSADRTCSNQATFMFEPSLVIDKYNSNTGTYETTEVQSQLYVIVEALRTFAELSSNFVGHGAKNANSWTVNSIRTYIQGIATKLGVSVQAGNYAGAPTSRFGAGIDDGESGFAQQPQLAIPNANALDGANDAVAWSSGMANAANVGHTDVGSAPEAVSSLEDIMQ